MSYKNILHAPAYMLYTIYKYINKQHIPQKKEIYSAFSTNHHTMLYSAYSHPISINDTTECTHHSIETTECTHHSIETTECTQHSIETTECTQQPSDTKESIIDSEQSCKEPIINEIIELINKNKYNITEHTDVLKILIVKIKNIEGFLMRLAQKP